MSTTNIDHSKWPLWHGEHMFDIVHVPLLQVVARLVVYNLVHINFNIDPMLMDVSSSTPICAIIAWRVDSSYHIWTNVSVERGIIWGICIHLHTNNNVVMVVRPYTVPHCFRKGGGDVSYVWVWKVGIAWAYTSSIHKGEVLFVL